MVCTTVGGFNTFPVSSEGVLGTAVESRLMGSYGEYAIDCVTILEK